MTLGYIFVWLVIGELISIISNYAEFEILPVEIKFIIPFVIALFSINFAASSACCNTLLKYKELNKDKNISPIINEISSALKAMFAGIILIVLIVFAIKFVKTGYLYSTLIFVALRGLIYSVVVMYLYLIYDIGHTFFDLVKNTK